MIQVYTGKKGLLVLVLLMTGMILFLSAFFWGITAVIQLFLPLLIIIAYLLIIVFLIGVLPATCFKNMRPFLAMYSLWMSRALSATCWGVSFFIVVKAFGFFGILFIFAFKFLIPIALLGAMLKGSWSIAAHLSLWISFIYGMRVYSQWLLRLKFTSPEKGRIIDIEATEVKTPLPGSE